MRSAIVDQGGRVIEIVVGCIEIEHQKPGNKFRAKSLNPLKRVKKDQS